MLEVKNLSYRTGLRQILKEMTLTVEAGEIVGVLGENGAGKTTFMRALAGLIHQNMGQSLRLMINRAMC